MHFAIAVLFSDPGFYQTSRSRRPVIAHARFEASHVLIEGKKSGCEHKGGLGQILMDNSNRLRVKFVAFLKIGNLPGFTDQLVKLLVTVAGVVENSFRSLFGFVTAKTKRIRVAGIDHWLGAA